MSTIERSPKGARQVEEPSDQDAARARELLAEERSSIDNIDAALIHLLAERFRHTQHVGRLKAAHDLPPADPAREAQQIRRMRALADESGLDPTFAEAFLRFIVDEVIRHHEHLREYGGAD
jgi:chorismate mutase